jgi:replicative DNA helicase
MLRSSGRIEEVADVIAFMYQPKKSRPKKGDPPAEPDNTVSILFTKNRRGPTGEFKLVYLKAEHRFESIAN